MPTTSFSASHTTGLAGLWSFTGWELLDLSTLEVRLKAEFQASNRDLYDESAPLASSRPTGSQ